MEITLASFARTALPGATLTLPVSDVRMNSVSRVTVADSQPRLSCTFRSSVTGPSAVTCGVTLTGVPTFR